MADFQTLLKQVEEAERKGVADAIHTARRALVDAYPEAPEAAGAAYKLGLHTLFHLRQIDEAVHLFDIAAASGDVFWSMAARTSLGLCYYHRGDLNKAMFELRKVGYGTEVNAHSVTALAFLENILSHGGQTEEAGRVRKDRIHQLRKLWKSAQENDNGLEQGFNMHQLAVAYLDQGDEQKAEEIIEEAIDLGADVIGVEQLRDFEKMQDQL